jgi:DNA-binding NarL/FixJ family response regulator
MKQAIRVMLVEDNPEYREVINLALEDELDIDLISQFGTTEVALRNIQDPKPPQQPDLILLDLQLPGMSGIEALPYFKTVAPDTKILILTQSDNESHILSAISNGADGYLLKSADLDEITNSIRTVMDGGASLDPNVAKFILNTLQRKLPQTKIEATLTMRELEVLELIADGMVKKEIAEQLSIGYTTVDSHVGNIYKKLDVKNAPAAISKAFREGIL